MDVPGDVVQRRVPGGGGADAARRRTCASRACCSTRGAPRSWTCCARWAATSRPASTATAPEPVGLDRGPLVAAARRRRSAPAVVPALIDEVPALAVAAALAEGTFTVVGRRRAAREGERPHRGPGGGPGRDGRRGRGAARRVRHPRRPAAARRRRRVARRPPHRDGPGGGGARRGGRDRDRGRRAASPSPSRSSSTCSARRGRAVAEPARPRVVLVGFMGAGKTHGRAPRLARAARLGLPRPGPADRARGRPDAWPRSSGRAARPRSAARSCRGPRGRRRSSATWWRPAAAPSPSPRPASVLPRRRLHGLAALRPATRCSRASPPDGSRPLAADRETIARTVRPSGSPPTAWPTGRSTPTQAPDAVARDVGAADPTRSPAVASSAEDERAMRYLILSDIHSNQEALSRRRSPSSSASPGTRPSSWATSSATARTPTRPWTWCAPAAAGGHPRQPRQGLLGPRGRRALQPHGPARRPCGRARSSPGRTCSG